MLRRPLVPTDESKGKEILENELFVKIMKKEKSLL